MIVKTLHGGVNGGKDKEEAKLVGLLASFFML